MAYCTYLLYLALSDNWQLTLAVAPLFLIFFNRRYTPWLLLLCFCLDVNWSMLLVTPFETTNVFLRGSAPYWQAPLVALSALALLMFIAYLLSSVRKKAKVLTLPFIIGGVILIVESFRLTSLHPIATVLSLIAKKYWITFLLALEYQYSRISLKDTVAGLVAPSAMFRESFKLDRYEVNLHEGFKWGGILSAMTIAGLIIYNQIFYQITGLLSSTVVVNSFSFNLVCHSTLTTLAPPEAFTRGELFGCFLANDLFRGIIKHIFLDSMIFVIPGLMMGWRFSLPFSNFMTAKTWPSFLFKLFYYYALIIYRLFTVEFYHLLQLLFKKRSSWHLPLATFFGVFVGGYCFHALKDFAYIQQFTPHSAFTMLFSWNSFTYFFTIALFCAVAEARRRRNQKMKQWLWITNAFYFVMFLFLRSLFSTYFHQVDFETKIKLLLRLFY